MSKTIDQKVVEMQFDNRQFEKNVSTTMSSIDKLKQKLNFSGSAKGLSDISSAAKKVDMSGLSNAVDVVKSKFSAMEVMGVTALANITNSAVNAGKRIVSALTIDPITTGFKEYETQINAVQTILANTQSKGTTLSDVNAALDELNTYADKTIYNFTEMTRNIGTFTAAGVELDKSVTSIKGIANLAAVSGSNAQQASTAMYQLSQALAAGRVSLMDWNSVVNAGMGGELFQNALKRTATQMGYNVDALIEKYGSFRESLTQGQWLTAEVLTETLTQLSGAYTEADLIAQGYTKDQAKEITQLAQTAVDAATKVKTFTQLWDTMKEAAQSGWTQTWEIMVGDFEESKSFLTELSDTFGGIIGASAEARNNLLYDTMTSNWKKITDGITEAGLSAEVFKDKIIEVGKSEGVDIDSMIADYGSLEAAFKNGALSSELMNKALIKIAGTSEENSKKLSELQGKYKTNASILNALKDAGYDYNDTIELQNKNLSGEVISLNDLNDAQLLSIGYTAEQIKSIRKYSNNLELVNGSLSEFIDNVSKPMGREMILDILRVSIRSLIDIFGALGDAWREVFPPTTSNQLLGIIESIRNFALELRPSQRILQQIQSTFKGLFSILSIGKQAISSLLKPIGDLLGGFSGLGGSILETTAAIGEWLFSIDQSIKAGDSFSVIGDIITSVFDGIKIAVKSVSEWFGGFGGFISGLGDAISWVFNGIKNVVDWVRENISAGDIFAGLAGGGIFVLAKKLSGFIDKIKDAFDGLFEGSDIGGNFSEILGSVHDSLESFQNGIKVASLVGIAVAVTLLTSSLRKISEIEPEKIVYSLITIRLMIASLNSGFESLVKTLRKFDSKGTIKAGIAMIALAEAVNILSEAIVTLSQLDLDEIAKGLLAVGGAMAELVLAMRFLNGTKINLRTSIAMIAIAEACKILSDALVGFSKLSWDEIGRGLTAMAGALGEVTASVAILSRVGGSGSLLGSAGIWIIIQGLEDLSIALKSFSEMAWDEIGRGLSAMGGALLEVGTVTAAVGKIAGFSGIIGGTAILIVIQGLDDLSLALKSFSEMAWDEIGRGLSAMGGALLEVGVVTATVGKIAGFSSLFGAGGIWITIQGLEDLSIALKSFSEMAWDEIGRGLSAMGGALLEVGAISGGLGKLVGFSGIFGAGTIWIAVQGLDDLANALKSFSEMAWDEIGRGLTAMGGALLEVSAISGATGYLTNIAGLVGAGTLYLGIQGLDDLANALKKFGTMNWDEIGRGLSAMGGAMVEVAVGSLLNTLSGFGAHSIATVAEPLGTLADSVQKWAGVTIPESLGGQLSSLASGVMSFNFAGWGADAIAAMASPIGAMADSMLKWQGVTIPESLSGQLSSLASGVEAFNFAGWGADAIASVAISLGDMATSITKWNGVTVAEDIGTNLTNLADGVKAFNFAFLGSWSISDLVQPLSDLADSVTKWNGVTITSTLGTDLTNLANGISSFGLFDGWSVDGIVDPLSDLADSVAKWNDLDVSSLGTDLKSLSSSLTTLGDVGVADLADDFEDARVSISKSVSGIFTDITTAIESKKGEVSSSFGNVISDMVTKASSYQIDFTNVASTLVTAFDSSISSNSSIIVGSFTKAITDSITSILSTKVSLATTATELMIVFANTIKNKSLMVRGSFDSVMSKTVSNIRDYYKDFYDAGGYLVQGFNAGMSSRMSSVVLQAQSMANTAYNSAMNALDAHSPSRKFISVGSYVTLGFAKGIKDGTNDIETSANSMAKTAFETTRRAISKFVDLVNSDVDTQPTIRPVLDLSSIKKETGKLNTMFSRNKALSVSRVIERRNEDETQNGETSSNTGVTNQFIQNNYSPKALSRIELYRQTKNQFSAFERVTKA